jgi:bacteriocin-like protein
MIKEEIMNELTIKELSVVNGGATFAYRIGQACAILYDLSFGGRPYIIDTKGVFRQYVTGLVVDSIIVVILTIYFH